MTRVQLTDEEVEELQGKIIKEHYIPTAEAFSLHIYKSWWVIDGVRYTMYKPIGHEGVEVYREDGSIP